MIKIILSAMLCLLSASAFCQQTNPEGTLTQQDFLKKSKKQKKAAFVILGAGTGVIIASLIIPKGDLVHDGICIGGYCSDKYENDGIKNALLIAGGVVALGSIPLFIVSGKNRRKATAVSFKLENTVQPYNQDLSHTSFPALRVKFSF